MPTVRVLSYIAWPMGLLFGLVWVANGLISLDNTCTFGTNYVQLVGFACLADEEAARNPAYDGITWRTEGQYDLQAYRVINKNMNRLGIAVGNVTYCANMTVVNNGCGGDVTNGSFSRETAAFWATRADFFFSAFGSTQSPPLIMEINNVSKIIFASMSASSINFRCQEIFMSEGLQPECQTVNAKRWPWAYSMMVTAEQEMEPVITLLKLAGVKDLALWHENGPYPIAVGVGAERYADYTGLRMKYNSPVTFSPSQEEIDQLVLQLKESKPEAVLGGAYLLACDRFYKSLRKFNWVPPATMMTLCTGDPHSPSSTPDGIYGLDFVEYDRRMIGHTWVDDLWYPPGPDTVTSPQQFYDDALAINGIAPYWATAIVAGAGLTLHKAIERAQSLSPVAVQQQLRLMNDPSFIGQIGFSAWGQNNARDVIIVQADQNYELQILYPLGAATANIVYPTPTFDERVFTLTYMSQPVELALAGVVAFFICVSLALLGFVIYNRQHPTIRAASPVFSIAIIIGSIMLYSTYYSWVVLATTPACYLRFWSLGLGFVLTFGALFAKTWRVMRIFLHTDLRVFKITNFPLLIILAVLLSIETVLLGVWSGISRPEMQVKVVDVHRPSKNQHICVNNNKNSGTVMLAVLVTYKLLMVGYGIYMSIRTWKVPLKDFNESKAIAFSMYNMLCFGVLALGLQVSGVISDPAMFVVRSVLLIISTFLTLVAIFGPKIKAVYTGHTGYTESGSERIPSVKRSTNRSDTTDYSLKPAQTTTNDPSTRNLDDSPTEGHHQNPPSEVIKLTTEVKKLKKKLKDLNTRFMAEKNKNEELEAKLIAQQCQEDESP